MGMDRHPTLNVCVYIYKYINNPITKFVVIYIC